MNFSCTDDRVYSRCYISSITETIPEWWQRNSQCHSRIESKSRIARDSDLQNEAEFLFNLEISCPDYPYKHHYPEPLSIILEEIENNVKS